MATTTESKLEITATGQSTWMRLGPGIHKVWYSFGGGTGTVKPKVTNDPDNANKVHEVLEITTQVQMELIGNRVFDISGPCWLGFQVDAITGTHVAEIQEVGRDF